MAYGSGTVLNPKYKWDLLTSMWTGKNISLLEVLKKRMQNMWISRYQDG